MPSPVTTTLFFDTLFPNGSAVYAKNTGGKKTKAVLHDIETAFAISFIKINSLQTIHHNLSPQKRGLCSTLDFIADCF
jgi:hypothetical protein